MKIALVEDDINLRKSLEMAFSYYGDYEVKSFKNAKEALRGLDESFEMIVTDLTMPGMDGIEFIRELGGKYEVIVITGNATLGKAIDSIRLGVKDFITKPFEIQTLIDAINRESERPKKAPNGEMTAESEPVSVKEESEPKKKELDASEFAYISESLENCLKGAKRAARTDASIMLLGESGVGKELFAKFIHRNSLRASRPFVAINMAAIPDNLIESELFGYEKGAFTDAQALKQGRFEVANGGTLFLDEIGEMPYQTQSKLLRVLQEREIMRLGGVKPIKIDVRIISATNANLEKNIKDGLFREDLYYRLNTVPVKIPPLRERKDEILPIAEKILLESIKKYRLTPKSFEHSAIDALMSHEWPGNIRELISVVERVAILSENDEITTQEILDNL